MNLSTLGTSAQELLDALIEELEKIPGYVQPPSSYVAAGEVPWDGESLCLYLGATGQGQAGEPATQNVVSVKAMYSTVEVYVQLIRPVSSFGYFASQSPMPASDDQLNAEGIQAFNDAGALILAATMVKKRRQIVKSSQASFVIGAINPIGPQGELSAVRLSLTLTIEEL